MSVSSYEELRAHVGHELKCVAYGGANVAIECLDCNEIIVDYDKYSDEEVYPVYTSKDYEITRSFMTHAVYRHFKGKFYYVIGLAHDTETDEYIVMYHALYGDGETYVRPLGMFVSEVPEGKENPTGQKYRFELYEFGEEQ